MKRQKSLKIAVIVLLAMVFGGFIASCGSDEDEPMEMAAAQDKTDQKTPSKPGDEQSREERKIRYWQAPMNPSEIYDRPGKSAMGMDLVPVYEDDTQADAEGLISIDPVTVQNMGVRYGMVERVDFSRNIRTVGKIEYDQDKIYDVNTKVSGWIEKLYVNYTGEMVNKGQPLLEIYSPELVSTQQEYLLALKTRTMVSKSKFASIREGSESLLESTRKRLLYWDVPPSEIERLEKTGEVRKTILLRAPATGMVVEKNAVDGAHIKEGVTLFQIANLNKIWVHASIYDYEVPWVHKGQNAEMELSYLPGETYQGKVSYVYPFLGEKARDVRVRMEFDNPTLDLKPGMYANVQLQSTKIANALVVPGEAIIRSGRRNMVFTERSPGKFEPREIRIGEEGGAGNRYVRVLSGLSEGERVVTSAQFLLDSESRLQEAIQKMLKERQPNSQAQSQNAEEQKGDSPQVQESQH